MSVTEPSDGSDPREKPRQKPLEFKERTVLIVGVLLIGIFLLFTGYLLFQTAASEIAWSRMVFLFGGLEALAFAAGGYLFGKAVTRERADKAEKRADAALEDEKKALTARSAVESKLSSLVKLIDTKSSRRFFGAPIGSRPVMQKVEEFGPDRRAILSDVMQEGAATRHGDASDTDWEELVEFAHSLQGG